MINKEKEKIVRQKLLLSAALYLVYVDIGNIHQSIYLSVQAYLTGYIDVASITFSKKNFKRNFRIKKWLLLLRRLRRGKSTSKLSLIAQKSYLNPMLKYSLVILRGGKFSHVSVLPYLLVKHHTFLSWINQYITWIFVLLKQCYQGKNTGHFFHKL